MRERELREAVLERDRHCCIFCGKGTGTVHHVISRKRRKEWPEVWSMQNMVALCPECHIDRPGGKGAHNQKARLRCIDYLIEFYGIKWYEEREPWNEVLRRG